MQQNIRYTISIVDAQDVVTFSVEFHRQDLRAIRRAIQSHFHTKFPVEQLKDNGARITIVSDGQHGVAQVRSLFHCFHHVVDLRSR